VATHPYRVELKDGSTQDLPKVWKQANDGPFLVFFDEEAEVHRVPATEVKSVTRTDQPEPTRRSPRVGAI
jgi:hypothetical protein